MGLVLTFKGGKDVGRQIVLSPDKLLTIGAGPSADLIIGDDPFVDREHCVIESVAGGELIVRDLNSRQGTFINGQRVSHRPLHRGDVLRIGLTMLRLEASSGENPVADVTTLHSTSRDSPTPPDVIQPAKLQAVENDVESSMSSELIEIAASKGFQLVRQIGRGGMGCVLLARRVCDSEMVAIKFFDTLMVDSAEAVLLFGREMKVHAELAHPHIVRLLDVMSDHPRRPWFAMQYIGAPNLKELLGAQGPLTLIDTCQIGLQIVSALEYAHQLPPPRGPVVHRDIKPSNVLVSGAAGSFHAWLADFGLAKHFEQAGLSGLTVTGQPRGTLDYMSREQLLDSKYAGPEADIFGVGATLYYALCGQSMYQLRDSTSRSELVQQVLSRAVLPIQSRRSDVPAAIVECLNRSLGIDEVRRFRTMRQLRMVLTQVLSDLQA